MSLTAQQRFKVKKFVKEIENFRGRHTELVSVYIPSGYDINKIVQHLSQEQGTASNIKSSSTRKNVQDALERMIQHLKLFTVTPPNGLACFSGNVAEREGQSDVQVWSIEPPIPINTRLYRCDKEFVLDLLRDMYVEKTVYALVVMDRRDADLALLKGKTIVPVQKTHSEVPGKFRAGGQSAARFARLRGEATKQHYKKVAEYMKNNFLPIIQDIRGIILGGPSTTTNEFINKEYLTGEIKKKIIGVKDLSYTGDFGLNELVDKSSDLLASEEIAQEKDAMGKFFHLLSTQEGKVAYGEADVMQLLKNGTCELVLVSETLNDDKIEEFDEESQKMGTEMRIISTETREGVQLRDIGKVVAILRYDTSH